MSLFFVIIIGVVLIILHRPLAAFTANQQRRFFGPVGHIFQNRWVLRVGEIVILLVGLFFVTFPLLIYFGILPTAQ